VAGYFLPFLEKLLWQIKSSLACLLAACLPLRQLAKLSIVDAKNCPVKCGHRSATGGFQMENKGDISIRHMPIRQRRIYSPRNSRKM